MLIDAGVRGEQWR